MEVHVGPASATIRSDDREVVCEPVSEPSVAHSQAAGSALQWSPGYVSSPTCRFSPSGFATPVWESSQAENAGPIPVARSRPVVGHE